MIEVGNDVLSARMIINVTYLVFLAGLIIFVFSVHIYVIGKSDLFYNDKPICSWFFVTVFCNLLFISAISINPADANFFLKFYEWFLIPLNLAMNLMLFGLFRISTKAEEVKISDRKERVKKNVKITPVEGTCLMIIITKLLATLFVWGSSPPVGSLPFMHYFAYIGVQVPIFLILVFTEALFHSEPLRKTKYLNKDLWKNLLVFFLFFYALTIIMVERSLPLNIIIFSHLTWFSLIVTSLLMRVEYLGSKMLSQKEAVAGSLVTLFAIYVLIYIHELGLIW